MKTFKHSGTLGDILYSLPVVKHLGGGEFYLHLNQVNWIAQYYYNSKPSNYHQNRMNEKDVEFIYDFMMAQSYITKFQPLTPTQEITHNLDRFRPAFVHHPANYITVYAHSWGIRDEATLTQIINEPWFTNPNKTQPNTTTAAAKIVVNRTARGWCPPTLNPQWTQWLEQEWDQQAVFVGLPEEYQEFKDHTGWRCPYQPCTTLAELADIIANAQLFIGNQSMALALAQGLGRPYYFERRQDLPLNRNESYFPSHSWGNTF